MPTLRSLNKMLLSRKMQIFLFRILFQFIQMWRMRIIKILLFVILLKLSFTALCSKNVRKKTLPKKCISALDISHFIISHPNRLINFLEWTAFRCKQTRSWKVSFKFNPMEFGNLPFDNLKRRNSKKIFVTIVEIQGY